MVREPKTQDRENEVFKKKQQIGLVPKFEKLADKRIDQAPEVVVSDEEREIISEICPHYYDLKDRYGEYLKYDDEGKNPLPLRIDRIHELSAFEATIAQADLTKDIEVTPTRLIKAFDFSNGKREAYLIVDKRVIGIDGQGRSTNISTVRTGKFKYPTQFEQDNDGDWAPVLNKMKTIMNIPFDKELAQKLANQGNPYTKKYCVWHPDGMRRGYLTLEQFLNLSDDEQISLIEQAKR